MNIIDLTLPINNQIPVFPGDPTAEVKRFLSLEKDGVNVSTLFLSTHFSTHLDAPFHFIPEGKKISEFGAEKFVGNGVVIDFRNQSVARHDIDAVGHNDIVLLHTGHTNRMHQRNFFEHYPCLDIGTAALLVDREVKMVGIDSFTIDAEPYAVHKLLLAHDILIIENLVNLNKLINKRFTIFALPLKMETDGSPCRVIAVLDE